LKWQATPKLLINVTTAATVAPPQNIVADFERIQSNSLSASYLYSPKLTFTAAVGQSHLSNPTSSGFGASPILQDQRVYFTELRTNYAVTPLTNAFFQYRYTNRKDETQGVTSSSNLFMVGLNYRR
jgi:predicted porin